MENSDKKKLMIIEAATKRFAHFGLAKTTMNEIAKDLALSKALLYYYFPDKNSLYNEVFLYIIQKMSNEIRLGLEKIDGIEDAMIYFLDQRLLFIQEYYNLINYSPSKTVQIPKSLHETYAIAERIEIDLIKTILIRITAKDRRFTEDCEEMAQIFLYSMIGMRFSVLSKTQKSLFPTREQFNAILHQQKKVVLLLLRGIMK